MMMMHQKLPVVDIPPWNGSPTLDEAGTWPVSGVLGSSGGSSSLLLTEAAFAELQQYLPSDDESDCPAAVDAYSCDEFRMYEFKIRRCARGRSHDWTECPYAHPGEKARRRDPRKYHYSGTACPDFRKGCCKRMDACEYAHGVFECWLHPARYRTQPCKDGTACRRRVCFFAHTPDQLRVLPQSPKSAVESYDGSPMRQSQQFLMGTPPTSPSGETPSSAAVNELLLSSLRKMQLGKVKQMPMPSSSPSSCSPSWGFGRGGGGGGGFCSLPSTPTRNANSLFSNNGWALGEEEEVVAEERVESGRALRKKLYEKLSKDVVGPDVGWVSELVM
ncbi:putative zinc finger CCCH domain-containing protein 2 [Iris pallida]|uniref:Zinc finger CCCH domain-containing protein 2 n=1 Tax=Iris pallida TaxID=29817 RepID=A0AAX6HPA1_IRIPA|nr:putative zinc finger CCCH domain-containing protein 2 [Iris pallida]KAJ6853818.1 putative zinc finger CCCH domain-containing protein 2 [Iris pallida]